MARFGQQPSGGRPGGTKTYDDVKTHARTVARSGWGGLGRGAEQWTACTAPPTPIESTTTFGHLPRVQVARRPS
ncbi:hypothetical protein GCM10010341_71970 [Streptomyces noursei]|nr:hypothetical protein GCM10010341_71970 [Streptomyces noursei]